MWCSSDIDLLTFLRFTGVSYIDKHANGGSLRIVGGKEFLWVVSRAKDFGYTFHFKEGVKEQLGINQDGGQNKILWFFDTLSL